MFQKGRNKTIFIYDTKNLFSVKIPQESMTNLELMSEFSKVIRYKISKQKWTTFLNTDNMWKLKLKI